MSKTIARAIRSGRWWGVRFDCPTGTFFTQARRLDQVADMVRDILTMEGIIEADIRVVPQLDEVIADKVAEAVSASLDAAAAAAHAAKSSREAVAALVAQGFTVRDIGTMLGVTPQRVSQLAK